MRANYTAHISRVDFTFATPWFGDVASQLSRYGYRPVPLVRNEKRPIPRDWANYKFRAADAQIYAEAGIDILTGNVIGVDIDVRDRHLAEKVRALAKHMLGPAPTRIGAAPKALLLYGVSGEPFSKMQTAAYRLAADSYEGKPHRVEVLADGQQFVVYNYHPETGKPYIWVGGRTPLNTPTSKLTTITRAQVQAFLKAVEALLAKRATKVGKFAVAEAEATDHVPNAELRAQDPALLRDALRAIRNDDEDYDSWMLILMATKGALGDAGYDEFSKWSAKSRKNVPEVTTEKWRSFNPKRIGAGTIYYHAMRHGWKPSPNRSGPTMASPGVWSKPQPLDRQTDQGEHYPVDALPGVIGAAVREYQAYGQQPVALVASSALAVVSLAAQGLADVARDERLCGPLSLNFLIVAQSGERKTAADKALGAALGDWERDRKEALSDDFKRNRALLDVWAAEEEGLKAAIKAAVRNKPDNAEKLRRRLLDHAEKKPTELIVPRLRYEDVNPQSLAFMLATGYQSAALWSDEGGMVTGSQGMGRDSLLAFMSGLNRLWDGGAIHHDRKQAQSVHLEGRRLTVSLMVPPMVLRELAQRSGGLTRGSGFLARYLVAAPSSTMGTRLYQEPPRGMPSLTEFHQRIRKLLDTPLALDNQGRLTPSPLRLSARAFNVWRDFHDAIERELKPLGEYATVCDFAAKIAENAARIAGCLHVFDGQQGAISRDTMERASTLARWYLREALRVLVVLDEPRAWADARLLDAWLAAKGYSPMRNVLRLGPSPLRDGARRDAAIAVLTELGRTRVERDGRRETLTRNPALGNAATATIATLARSKLAKN